ncbi:hypothetical protein H9P43_002489 [Blastocladiella emersonii ATCC 22665]|nr:hypothetical protein H9P43_002489 [Blastocladiella emersonii ATCC 22665]
MQHITLIPPAPVEVRIGSSGRHHLLDEPLPQRTPAYVARSAELERVADLARQLTVSAEDLAGMSKEQEAERRDRAAQFASEVALISDPDDLSRILSSVMPATLVLLEDPRGAYLGLDVTRHVLSVCAAAPSAASVLRRANWTGVLWTTLLGRVAAFEDAELLAGAFAALKDLAALRNAKTEASAGWFTDIGDVVERVLKVMELKPQADVPLRLAWTRGLATYLSLSGPALAQQWTRRAVTQLCLPLQWCSTRAVVTGARGGVLLDLVDVALTALVDVYLCPPIGIAPRVRAQLPRLLAALITARDAAEMRDKIQGTWQRAWDAVVGVYPKDRIDVDAALVRAATGADVDRLVEEMRGL